MRLAHQMKSPTQLDRITALEERADDVDKALAPMQLKLDEIHELLFAAKAILKLVGKIVTWAGGPTVVIGLGLAVWKYLSTH